MRSFCCLLLGGMLLTGCAGPRSKQPKDAFASPESIQPKKEAPAKIITSPSATLIGTVVSVQSAARFAVLNFPVGRLPLPDQHLFAYRQGLKVAELKVTSWKQDENVVADIVSGEVLVGDELRTE